jgi:hypothetical protein
LALRVSIFGKTREGKGVSKTMGDMGDILLQLFNLEDTTCRNKGGECLGPLRHGRQSQGVVSRLGPEQPRNICRDGSLGCGFWTRPVDSRRQQLRRTMVVIACVAMLGEGCAQRATGVSDLGIDEKTGKADKGKTSVVSDRGIGEKTGKADRGNAIVDALTWPDHVKLTDGKTPISDMPKNCWKTMTSGTTESLAGVWGSGVSNVFAVGLHGTIQHYDGSSWSGMSAGTSDDLLAVWGAGGSDVYASGQNGLLLHYNGTNWSKIPTGTVHDFRSIWGSGTTDIYLVGDSWTGGYPYVYVMHYDGTTISQWKVLGSDYARGIWGISPSDLFVSLPEKIYHFDGSGWSYVNLKVNLMRGLWGSGASDVFAVGQWGYGEIYHYDGTSWNMVFLSSSSSIESVWGSSATDVYAVGTTIAHYDGTAWSEFSLGGDWLYSISGTATTDIWAVGLNGRIMHCGP